MLIPPQPGHLTSRGLMIGSSGAEFDFEVGIFSAVRESAIPILFHQTNPDHHPIA